MPELFSILHLPVIFLKEGPIACQAVFYDSPSVHGAVEAREYFLGFVGLTEVIGVKARSFNSFPTLLREPEQLLGHWALHPFLYPFLLDHSAVVPVLLFVLSERGLPFVPPLPSGGS